MLNRSPLWLGVVLALVAPGVGAQQVPPQTRALGNAWVQLEMASYARDWCVARAPATRAGVQRDYNAWLRNSPKAEIENWFRAQAPAVLDALRTTTAGQRDAVHAGFDRGFPDAAGPCASFRETFLATLDVDASALTGLRADGPRSALPAARSEALAPRPTTSRPEDPDLRAVAQLLAPLRAVAPMRYGGALREGRYQCTHVQIFGSKKEQVYVFNLDLYPDRTLRIDGVRDASSGTPRRRETTLEGSYQYDDINGALEAKRASGGDVERFLPSNGRYDSAYQERRQINAFRHLVDARGQSFLYGQQEYGANANRRLLCAYQGGTDAPSPEQARQARSAARTAERDRFRTAPDRGLQPGEIAAVVHHYFNEYTITGLQAAEQTVLLLKDGRAYLNLQYTPHDLDARASAQGEPAEWVRWRRAGKDYEISSTAGRWSTLQGLPGVPARRGEKLDGRYSRAASARIGNDAGGATGVARWDYIFMPDGRFSYSSETQAGGQMTGGVAATHGLSRARAAERTGRYRFVDYTLELRFEDGTVRREYAFFWDDKRTDLVIGGETYRRRTP